MRIVNYIQRIIGGLWGLLQGLYVSMRNMCRKKVTEKYPENRATKQKMERFRGQLYMPHNERNEHKCTACGICQMNCPNNTIRVVSKKITNENGEEKRVLAQYLYDIGSCAFCALCTASCPQNAIDWLPDFEHTVFTRDKLIRQLNRENAQLEEKTNSIDMIKVVIFYILAAFISVSAILAVTSKKILRAATFLLSVLLATAGLYILLDYHFLAAVQIAVYAGGILVLFIFAILLTSQKGDRSEPDDKRQIGMGVLAAAAGFAVTVIITAKHNLLFPAVPSAAGEHEIDMKVIGHALFHTEKYGYLLPFEVLGVLLLVSIVGGILIARKR